MFRFENTDAFYWFILLPLMAFIWYLSAQRLKQRLTKMGNHTTLSRLITGKSNTTIQFVMTLIIVTFLLLAAINPQWGMKKEKMKVERSDIFIALDISASMNATDISPSRLEKSKRLAEQLIEKRKGDRVGLILFAGGAYMQMPLTIDYGAAQLFVRSANTDLAGTQGTAIGKAIDLALHSTKEQSQKALIVITDGEDHDSDAIDMASKAAHQGWNVFTIGAGTTEGSFIPVLNEGREEFKLDDEGNPVKTVINESLLKEMAEKGNGEFYALGNDDKQIVSEIDQMMDKMQKRAVEVQSFSEYRSFYQYFLMIALLLVVIDFFGHSVLTIFNKRENIRNV
jgi:Ca-activated chloride channel family protein